MAEKLLIKNCRLIRPQKSVRSADILIENGRVKALDEKLSGVDAPVVDANGLCAAPGLVDMHVHLRDPGFTYKEDIQTGCRAAAAGGVTSLAAMPNTSPVADHAEILRYVREKSRETGIHVYPIGAVTIGQKGKETADFAALKNAGAAAFSDDGRPVEKASVMLEAMRAAHGLGVPVISHCEDLSLADGGIVNETIARTLGVKGLTGASEEVCVARETALSAHYGLPVHIAHISTEGSAALIRDAKRRGAPVTCETCPHYFSLDESLLKKRDADYRMNPPLRSRRDVEAIREALRDGTIDIIATDHAPHAAEEKSCFETAPNGVIGLETSLAAGITFLVKPGLLTLEALIRLMSERPAEILKIDAGKLEPGARADIVLFSPDEAFKVTPGNFHSKAKNSPFKGMTLFGTVRYTIANGKIIYENHSEV